MGTPPRKGGGARGDNDKKLSPSSNNQISPPSAQKCKSARKKKCKREGLSAREEDAPATNVAFADMFGGSTRQSHKPVVLGPKLTRRQNPFPVEGVPAEGDGCKLDFAPHDSETSATKTTPGSPSNRKSPKKLKLSPRKDPTSPLHPPRNLARTSSNINSHHLNEFTLTPTVLYEGHYNRRQRPMSANSSQFYPQSPHWSGQVRVNPFSPVPDHYLRPPPTSTKSASRESRRQHPGFYNLLNLEPPTPSMVELQGHSSKKARLNAIPSMLPHLNDRDRSSLAEISPSDLTQMNALFGKEVSGTTKRKADELVMPPPQPMESDAWLQSPASKRMRIKRGRYLDDFQEVKHLGSGSFGSVNACLSRLDGCMYAVKSISPTGQKKGVDNTVLPQSVLGGADYIYGGRKMMSNQCAIPPTPCRNMMPPSPLRRKKTVRRFDTDESDDSDILDGLEGSNHWNDGALRRVLREVSKQLPYYCVRMIDLPMKRFPDRTLFPQW